MKKLLTLLAIVASSYASAQSTVSGNVFDKTSGQNVMIATVVVENSTVGVTTDFDGKYSLELGQPGTYTLKCVSMGYAAKFKEVTVADGDVVSLDFDMETTAVVIDKKANIVGVQDKGRDTYLETMKKKEASMVDFISTKDIKTGESDVSGVMKRVSGVSKVGNQIYVRGLSDRYIKSTLNGAEIPSINARRNTVDLDIFPTGAMDNVIVVKSAKANLPGDFSGAYINMKTRDFPSEFSLKYSLSFNYNSATTFRDVLASETGGADWMAMDDGTRAIPDLIGNSPVGVPQIDFGNYYSALVAAGYEDELADLGVNSPSDIGLSGNQTSIYQIINAVDGIENIDQVNGYLSDYRENANVDLSNMGKSFGNNWDNEVVQAPLDMSHSLSFGNHAKLFGRNLGYNFGFLYRTRTRHYENGATGRYKLTGDENTTAALNTESLLSDSRTNSEVMWNALFNASYQLNENNTVTALFMPTRSARNVSRYQDGFNYSDENGLRQEQRTQIYNERQMSVYQLSGSHRLPFQRAMKFRWNGTWVEGQFQSPDFRVMFNSYNVNENDTTYDIYDNLYPSPTRFFRNLQDRTFDFKADLEIELSEPEAELKNKLYVGMSYVDRTRAYDENRYSFVSSGIGYDGNPDNYFSAENMNIIPGGDQGYLYLRDDSEDQNNYTANQTVQAAYAMVDYNLSEQLFVNAGLRLEQTLMNLESNIVKEQDLTDLQAAEFRGNLDNLDYLPSVNVTYRLIQEQEKALNLRGAFYSTIARPVFREKAPYSAFDFDQQEVLTGNVDLVSTRINNYDLRLEYFPRLGEILSVSAFYKDFTNPIEQVIIATASNVEISWENASEAKVYGMEFEAKKNLGFIAESLNNFSVGSNVTLVRSRTQIAEDELAQIRATDPDAEEFRPMFGQSPYIINALASYQNDSIGLSVNVSYNIQGDRLVLVTKGGTPDIYEIPRNLLNVTVNKKLNDHFSASLKALNILNADNRRLYEFKEEFYERQSFETGVNFSLGITYTF